PTLTGGIPASMGGMQTGMPTLTGGMPTSVAGAQTGIPVGVPTTFPSFVGGVQTGFPVPGVGVVAGGVGDHPQVVHGQHHHHGHHG
ncbi:hypothetical protein CN285_30755, partial [Bacillus cereus]